MIVRVARTWELTFDESAQQLWTTLADTGAYVDWWSWLEAEALPPLATGVRAELTIVPPLPYRLDVTVEVMDVVAQRHVEVAVHGDLTGRARVDLFPKGEILDERATGPAAPGCLVRLELDLAARRGPLRSAPTSFAPLLRLGHDLVMTQGLRQFTRATGLQPTTTRPAFIAPRQRIAELVATAGVITAVVLVAIARLRRPHGHQ